MRSFLQDIAYAIRQLRKSPGFTITAVLTLAIGIGANTASFSIMDAVVLRPLAVPELNHVVTLYEQQSHGDPQQVSLANFKDWKSQSHSFEELAVRRNADMSMAGLGEVASVQAAYTSPSFFSLLRTNAFLGRVFNLSETQPGRDNVVVLGYGFWKSQLGADPGILGRTLQLNQHPYTVIGIMPKNLQYPAMVDLFVPLAPLPAEFADRNSHEYLVLGRLRKGVTVGQAQSEMNLIADRLAHTYPATNEGRSAKVELLLTGLNGDLTPLYFNLIQGATLFVLLVVCVNVANLQFARGIARRPELAMRTALGAGRGRLLRQLLTENVLLALVGAAGGVAFAALDMHLSQILMPERVARYLAGWSNISLNGRALAYSLLLAVISGVLSGLAPALAALRIDLLDQLKAGSRAVVGSSRASALRNILAAVQVSLAVALVIGTALMCKGMMAMLHLGDRYQPTQMLTFNVHLPAARYGTGDKRTAWYSESLARIRALPGVEHAEATTALPYSDNGWLDEAQIEHRAVVPGKAPTALRLVASSGYFNAFHISLATGIPSGRLFSQSDDLHATPVAVVSREFASLYFPGESPLGHRIRMGGAGVNQTPWMTIAGVVEETNYSLWLRSRPAVVYMSSAQMPPDEMTYSIMTKADPGAIAPAVRKALMAIDPTLPLERVETYAQLLHEQLTGMFYVAAMLGFDALIALLLAAIGIFGAMANLVGERTREIGVRLAMGAQRQNILRMVLGRAAQLTGAGVCIGLAMAFGLARMLASLLYQVSPDDPTVFTVITVAIVCVALLASWLPARRASRLDPVKALRAE